MKPNSAIKESNYDRRGIIQAFNRANQKRLDLTKEYLKVGQKDFLEILPFLFHYNDEALPGYVSDITPSGISQYHPLQPTIQIAKQRFKNYKHIRRAKHQMDIHSLFIMGSAGSVAYSTKSDFDIWLLHSQDLDTQQQEQLSQKARLIEQWAETLRLEVHFFIFDANSFRSGQHQSLSTESSGSTQHSLLLDEFYRSSILLAGRYPIWWMVAPENDHQYNDYIDILYYSKLVSENDVIDLGSPCPIPTSEFFGAAVWQLYKGIRSPYKSVLKLLLMEVYASQHPDIDLLSTRFKRLIYENESNLTELDPYVIMYKTVENYLMTQQDKDRLEIFRECFYFKIGEKLSIEKLEKHKTNRRKFLEDMMLDWGWDQSNFSLLDMQNRWRIDDIIHHRIKIVNTLTKSYQFLSEFARNNAEVYRVSQTELNVLGRKLYAAFEKKNNKIEIINQASEELYETEVTIHETTNSDNQTVWDLYRGKIKVNELKDFKPLKRAKDIMELLLWCHINRVVNQHCAILLHTTNCGISTREIKDTFHALNSVIDSENFYQASFNDLSKPARIISTGLFINVGIDPLNKSQEDVRHIASSRQDALSFGARHENLAKSFDLILLTSWEEVLLYHYQDVEGLMKCICDYIAWTPSQNQLPTANLNVFSLSTPYGKNISIRIEDLFNNIIFEFVQNNKENLDSRYIIESEDNYFSIESKDKTVTHKQFKNLEALTHSLGLPTENFSRTIFDKSNQWQFVLSQIYKLNVPSVIQTFYSIDGSKALIHIIDEKGSLFTQTFPYHNTQNLITHLNRFYNSVLTRKNFMAGELMEEEIVNIEFYEIVNSRSRSQNIVKIDINSKTNNQNYINLQVIGSMDQHEKNHLTIYCDNEEFSSLAHGKEVLSRVADYVISKRKNNSAYPIYITDIDFSKSILDVIEPKNLQTIHFLKYKKKIEEKLQLALEKRSE